MSKQFLLILLILAVLGLGCLYVFSAKNQENTASDSPAPAGTGKTTKMHPSWDANGDGINDCEFDGTCDDAVDYTLPKPME